MKCSAALSVLALAIAATAAPLEGDNHNYGYEAQGYEAKSYEAKSYEAKGYDNGYYGKGRDYERGLENHDLPGYSYGKGRVYKRALQGKQGGYGRDYPPYGREFAPYGRDYGRDYPPYDRDYAPHNRYDPSRSYNDNLNGNSRDNVGNSRDLIGNRGDTNGNRGDTNGNRGDNCSAKSQSQVCCNGGLGCLVQVLGDHCGTSAYCCDTSSAPGTAVNLNLLNCLKL